MESSEQKRKAAVSQFYKAFTKLDDPALRVGWESLASQRTQLEMLAELASPLDQWDSIVDAGSGEGALLPILFRRGFRGHYRGEELREEAFLNAQAVFSDEDEENVEWVRGDSFLLTEKADLLLCSGALNSPLGAKEHQEEVKKAIQHLFSRAKVALIFDAVVKSPRKDAQDIHGVELFDLYSFLKSLSPIVAMHETMRQDIVTFELWKTRKPLFQKRIEDPLVVAENLLDAGEYENALASLDGEPPSKTSLYIRMASLFRLGQNEEARALLKSAPTPWLLDSSELGLTGALVYWHTGEEQKALQLLEALAKRFDGPRAYLSRYHMATQSWAKAEQLIQEIEDPWLKETCENELLEEKKKPSGR